MDSVSLSVPDLTSGIGHRAPALKEAVPLNNQASTRYVPEHLSAGLQFHGVGCDDITLDSARDDRIPAVNVSLEQRPRAGK